MAKQARVIAWEDGPVETANRMHCLTSQAGKTVRVPILKGKAPSLKDLQDAAFQKGSIPVKYFLLEFGLNLGNHDYFPLLVELRGLNRYLGEFELFCMVYMESVLRIFELKSQFEEYPAELIDVYVRYKPGERTGYVRLYKEVDQRIRQGVKNRILVEDTGLY